MSTSSNAHSETLSRTPLFAQHIEAGGRMVAFAGYEMPVQYKGGILEEHAWTRGAAGLFDISHMGEAHLVAEDGRHETATAALEALVPADILSLRPGQQRYTQLLADNGGIIDDFMVTRFAEGTDGRLLLVLNAARKTIDIAHMAPRLPSGVRLKLKDDRALLALQGPKAADVLAGLAPPSSALAFMTAANMTIANIACHVSRSGYTGEDGFEISAAAADIAKLWQALLRSPEVRPCGLGARDTLRLEAGLCLYGHELDETTSPIEAGLSWSIQKRRREAGGFPGYARLKREIGGGAARVRVGISLDGKVPARDGAEIHAIDGQKIGIVTSGGFSPTLKRPIAMGYVAPTHAAEGAAVKLIVRGTAHDGRIVKLPFVPHAYRRTV